ncbi:MAG: hypothetical protein Q8Q09_26000 [Deltaproteobacteria bacterium]|nr:hypothetical protein [Deltaproteobacteria bacterium]
MAYSNPDALSAVNLSPEGRAGLSAQTRQPAIAWATYRALMVVFSRPRK